MINENKLKRLKRFRIVFIIGIIICILAIMDNLYREDGSSIAVSTAAILLLLNIISYRNIHFKIRRIKNNIEQ